MNIMISLIRIFIIFIFCFSFGLHADFSDRMKNRLADVIAAKDSGSLGEGVDGFLHLRNQDDANARNLVDSENADRKSLFQSLAQKTGGSEETVARKFSQGIAGKAKKGHWFRKASGDWVQK
jgi:uncharacterized protein YdbL (DUF1318 family)